MDAVLGPDRLVREADLTANHSLAPRLAEAANRSSDPVSLAQAYVAIVLRQRSDLAMFIERRQDFAGDLVRYRATLVGNDHDSCIPQSRQGRCTLGGG